MKSHKAIWEEAAKEFSKMVEDDVHRKLILNPSLIKLIGEVKGRTIIDAGCGEGYLARHLAKEGAEVLAIDFSHRLIEEAKNKTPQELNVKFEQIDLQKPLPYPSDSSHLIICSMVLMDLPKIDKTLKEFYRIAKVNGELIVSICHPSYTVPFIKMKRSVSDVFLGKEAPIEIISYPESAVVNRKVYGMAKKTPYIQRRISFYFNTIAEAGFVIKRVEEPILPERYKKKVPKLWHATKIPLFLLIKAVK